MSYSQIQLMEGVGFVIHDIKHIFENLLGMPLAQGEAFLPGIIYSYFSSLGGTGKFEGIYGMLKIPLDQRQGIRNAIVENMHLLLYEQMPQATTQEGQQIMSKYVLMIATAMYYGDDNDIGGILINKEDEINETIDNRMISVINNHNINNPLDLQTTETELKGDSVTDILEWIFYIQLFIEHLYKSSLKKNGVYPKMEEMPLEWSNLIAYLINPIIEPKLHFMTVRHKEVLRGYRELPRKAAPKASPPPPQKASPPPPKAEPESESEQNECGKSANWRMSWQNDLSKLDNILWQVDPTTNNTEANRILKAMRLNLNTCWSRLPHKERQVYLTVLNIYISNMNDRTRKAAAGQKDAPKTSPPPPPTNGKEEETNGKEEETNRGDKKGKDCPSETTGKDLLRRLPKVSGCRTRGEKIIIDDLEVSCPNGENDNGKAICTTAKVARKVQLAFHPDKNTGCADKGDEAIKQFKELAQAPHNCNKAFFDDKSGGKLAKKSNKSKKSKKTKKPTKKNRRKSNRRR